MPKYKEININVKVAPEAILGNVLRDMILLSANQCAQTTTNKASDTTE